MYLCAFCFLGVNVFAAYIAVPFKYPRTCYLDSCQCDIHPTGMTRNTLPKNNLDNNYSRASLIDIKNTQWRSRKTNNGSKSAAPAWFKEVAIVMLNISSVGWERSSEGLGRECHPQQVLVKPVHSKKLEDMASFLAKPREGGRENQMVLTPHYMMKQWTQT